MKVTMDSLQELYLVTHIIKMEKLPRTVTGTCLVWLMLVGSGICAFEPDLEPVEFKPMRWGLENIILMSIGMALILAIIGTFIVLLILKPKHGMTIFNDDGTVNKAATKLKRRQSEALKNGEKMPNSLDLILQDELKNRAGKLKRPKSSLARKNIFKKSLKIHQHLPEMTEEERKEQKEPVEFKPMRWGLENIILMSIGMTLILAIIGTFIVLLIIKPKHGMTEFNDDGTVNKAATNLKRRQSEALQKGEKMPDSFDLILQDELKNRAGKLKRPKSSMARKNIFKKSLKIHQHLPEMTEEERKEQKDQLKKESKEFKKNRLKKLIQKGNSNNSAAINI